MGWSESLPLFCSSSETAQDGVQEMLEKLETLPPHPLENLCLPETVELPSLNQVDNKTLTKLLDVYMENFIGLTQAPTQAELLHFTRSVLDSIHTVFPLPGPSEDPNDEPISAKKTEAGGTAYGIQKKEILGWLFDGVSCCLSLPEGKVDAIKSTLCNSPERKPSILVIWKK